MQQHLTIEREVAAWVARTPGGTEMHKEMTGARFDEAGSTVIIDSLALTEIDVVEARHWVTGERGSAVTTWLRSPTPI